MKVFKQLLWFIIPTVLIWMFCFVYMYLSNKFSTAPYPKFTDYSHYLKLYVSDSVFLKALLNTLIISFAPAVIVAIVSYISKLIFKFNLVIMYCVAFILSTLAAFFANSILFGIPINFNVFSIVLAIQIGIICCFICWIVNFIKIKVQKKYCK